jgi:hypothetical protein
MTRLATALDELNQAFKQSGMKDTDAIVGAKEKYGLSVEEAKIVWLAFLWPGQGIGDAERPAKAAAAVTSDAGVKELFEIVENTINNERARVVRLTNQLMDHLAQGVSDGHVRVEDTAAKIKASANEMAGLAENLAAPWDDEGAREMAAELRKSMGQFEADSIVAAIIILARRAKFQNQKLIIGLETDWIPGYNETGSLQQNAISSLVNEVASLDKTLRSMGLENVVIVHKSKDELAMAISDEATRTNTKLTNVVLFGSSETLNSEAFNALRSAPGDARAFMAAVDPSELDAFYNEHKDSMEYQLKIRLMEMLCMALELAVGKEPPQLPIIASYDKELRTVIFLPKVEPADYEEIRRFYNAARTALQAA